MSSSVLKVGKDCAEVTLRGKPFQTRGAATPKTPSPAVGDRVLGVFNLERRKTSL